MNPNDCSGHEKYIWEKVSGYQYAIGFKYLVLLKCECIIAIIMILHAWDITIQMKDMDAEIFPWKVAKVVEEKQKLMQAELNMITYDQHPLFLQYLQWCAQVNREL